MGNASNLFGGKKWHEVAPRAASSKVTNFSEGNRKCQKYLINSR